MSITGGVLSWLHSMMTEIRQTSAFHQPTDLVPVRTGDGSFTLDSSSLGDHYHSRFGALAESRHVYIHHGFHVLGKPAVDILEVGLGTGLNALLTWEASDRTGIRVNYLALEPFPLPLHLWAALGHAMAMGAPEREEGYIRLMNAKDGQELSLSPGFLFRSATLKVQDLEAEGAFDLVYFDAFAPSVQPEMWPVEVFRKLYCAMRPEAILVTYCAKGDVRRAMVQAGFQVERKPGPPGKHEMLMARRPA